MPTALVVILVGLAVGLGAFIFAAINLLRGVSGSDPFFTFKDLARNHIGAMVVMAIGGFIATIGFLLGGYNVLMNLLR